jgi:hypothetical protein
VSLLLVVTILLVRSFFLWFFCLFCWWFGVTLQALLPKGFVRRFGAVTKILVTPFLAATVCLVSLLLLQNVCGF